MKNIKNIITFLLLLLLLLFNSCNILDSEPELTSNELTPNELVSINIENLNLLDTLVISNKFKFKIEGIYNNGQNKDLSDSIILESKDVTILNGNFFTTGSKGHKEIKIIYKEYIKKINFYSYDIEELSIPNNLKSTNDCHIQVPIIVINLLPTNNGVNHDETKGPVSFSNQITFPLLENSKLKIYEDVRITRSIIENGTRFRDYGLQNTSPYACINIVKIFNVYEWELKKWVNDLNTLDYKELFKRLNMEKIMNETSFKEVWINYFPYNDYPSVVNSPYNTPENYWEIPESNMSSPTSGDISNSYRIKDDLPIYTNTYVVYGNNSHRGVDTNLHNRGHQIEAQLRYIEKDKKIGQELFWNNFVGAKNTNNTGKITETCLLENCKHDYYNKRINLNIEALNGRCGNTHYPPNSESGYDYNQLNYVLSDIKTWKPSGGVFEKVNKNTWTSVNYNINMVNGNINYNNDPHTKWLLFWFQSIPGMNNNILYKRNNIDYEVENWWDIFYNWDNAIIDNKTLWK